MNTYKKYAPNVFVAQCEKEHEKGETITLTTKYGKEHECIVFNFLGKGRGGEYYYSIIRADGFNVQEYAKKKAERYNSWSNSANSKSQALWEASSEGKDFLVLAEPIKIGHHSEKRHRALIERNHQRMTKSMEALKVAELHSYKAEYWESRTENIDLSMPESVEYFEFKVEQATKKHLDLKSGKVERSHSFSLTYAKKDLNEAVKKFELAKKLWS